MTTYDKIRVKRRDLADTEARRQQLEADIAALPGGPGYAEQKRHLVDQVDRLHRLAQRHGQEIQSLTAELQPRLL